MPIPKPGSNENRNEFIKRCMGDSVMVSDFKDESQRMVFVAKRGKIRIWRTAWNLNSQAN